MDLITTAMVSSTRTSATTSCGVGQCEETVHTGCQRITVQCEQDNQA
jgi:hypothetical protein